MPDAASFINVPGGETRPPDTRGVAPRECRSYRNNKPSEQSRLS